MRILVVAMQNSIHTARWLNQIAEEGWDIQLFPVWDAPPHPELRNLTLHSLSTTKELVTGVRCQSFWPLAVGGGTLSMLAKKFAPHVLDPVRWLARVIRQTRPHLVHSLEMQHGAYVTLAAFKALRGKFPPWIVSNWGSDIYCFGRLAAHAQQIKDVLTACDYYTSECQRDVQLARQFGFLGDVLPVLPAAGGLDLNLIDRLRPDEPSSTRRLVVVKGHQNWAGRALVALRAVERCARELQGYRVVVYSAHPDVRFKAELITQATGVPIEIIPEYSHESMLRLFGKARAYLGLSISDGICTSMLEAATMGAFPIQSDTSCANEWLAHGETGMIVPPEDSEVVAAALGRALTDDDLVDAASQRNYQTARARLDGQVLRRRVVGLYRQVYEQRFASRDRRNGKVVNDHSAERLHAASQTCSRS